MRRIGMGTAAVGAAAGVVWILLTGFVSFERVPIRIGKFLPGRLEKVKINLALEVIPPPARSSIPSFFPSLEEKWHGLRFLESAA